MSNVYISYKSLYCVYFFEKYYMLNKSGKFQKNPASKFLEEWTQSLWRFVADECTQQNYSLKANHAHLQPHLFSATLSSVTPSVVSFILCLQTLASLLSFPKHKVAINLNTNLDN